MKHYVFGNTSNQVNSSSGYSTSSSDTSTTNSKANPLLVADTLTTDGTNGVFERSKRNSESCCSCCAGCISTFCGCLGHILILLLPLLAMIFTVAFLVLLAVFDRSEIQQTELYGDEEYMDLAKIYYASVSADTISMVMSQYEPYVEVMSLACVSCVLVTMVTAARNIQIEVYHKRVGSFVFMKFLNYLAAILNIAAYMGLLVAVNFKVTQEDPEYAVTAHFYGFCTFFGGSAAYAVLHSFLLWNQSEYPTFIKVIFYALAVVTAGASLAFGVPIWQGGLQSDEYTEPIYEWVAVFSSAISLGFYFILFFVDPVDDHLAVFFCGGFQQSTNPQRKRQFQKRHFKRHLIQMENDNYAHMP